MLYLDWATTPWIIVGEWIVDWLFPSDCTRQLRNPYQLAFLTLTDVSENSSNCRLGINNFSPNLFHLAVNFKKQDTALCVINLEYLSREILPQVHKRVEFSFQHVEFDDDLYQFEQIIWWSLYSIERSASSSRLLQWILLPFTS